MIDVSVNITQEDQIKKLIDRYNSFEFKLDTKAHRIEMQSILDEINYIQNESKRTR